MSVKKQDCENTREAEIKRNLDRMKYESELRKKFDERAKKRALNIASHLSQKGSKK